MARFNNENATKIEGNQKARFMGFKSVDIAGSTPMIKVVFKIEGTTTKLDYVLGSKVDIEKLNALLTTLGRPAVNSISEVDVPLEGGLVPADWDKVLIVETHYPVTTKKDASGKSFQSVSNFASVKSIIGLDTSVQAIPGAPAGVPTL